MFLRRPRYLGRAGNCPADSVIGGFQMYDSESIKQIHLERRSAAYWRVTFDIPP